MDVAVGYVGSGGGYGVPISALDIPSRCKCCCCDNRPVFRETAFKPVIVLSPSAFEEAQKAHWKRQWNRQFAVLERKSGWDTETERYAVATIDEIVQPPSWFDRFVDWMVRRW